MMTESDVIVHLIDEEAKAANLLSDARIEANKRIIKARTRAEAAYKTYYEQLVATLEADYDAQTEKMTQDYKSKVAEYRTNLEAVPTTNSGFTAFLDNLMFA